jgi:nicotinate-nucleotide adenylyltransferase
MGGSFDPVHVAHVALATTALAHLALDEVRWVPVGQAWQKARALAPADHRLAMLQAATAHEPRFVVDPIEVNRPGPSYTLDTVCALQANVGDNAQLAAQWFLIIGQDQLANLPTWHGWQALLSRVTLAVACRGHQAPVAPDALIAAPHQMVTLPLSPLDTSSTDIRARLARGADPRTLSPRLLCAGVADYIANHQLYAPGVPR